MKIISDFYDGLAIVTKYNNKGHLKYGYINKKGKEVIPPKYHMAYRFKKKYAFVKNDDDEPIMINRKGKEIRTFKGYKLLGGFKDGFAVIEKDSKCGILNEKGKIVIEPKFDSLRDFNYGLAAMEMDGKWGFINKKGEIVVEPRYGYVKDFSDGLAIAIYEMEESYFAILNTKGEEVFQSDNYNTISDFNDGLAAVSVLVDENKYKVGFIDKTGKEVVEPKYDGVLNFEKGLSVVQIKEEDEDLEDSATSTDDGESTETLYGLVNKNGEEVVEPIYEEIGDFSEGFILVRTRSEFDRKFGFLDYTGKEITEMEYDSAGRFSMGLAWIMIKNENGEKYGYIDTSGEIVIPAIYDAVGDFSQGLASVRKGDDWFIINKKGQVKAKIK